MNAPKNMLSAAYEPAKGLIRVTGSGLWSLRSISEHFAILDGLLAQARSERGVVRLISDLREAAVQDDAVAERLQSYTSRAFRPGDRIAILVVSSLIKLQMRRSVNNQDTEIFLSPSAAETWLFAHDHARTKAAVG